MVEELRDGEQEQKKWSALKDTAYFSVSSSLEYKNTAKCICQRIAIKSCPFACRNTATWTRMASGGRY